MSTPIVFNINMYVPVYGNRRILGFKNFGRRTSGRNQLAEASLVANGMAHHPTTFLCYMHYESSFVLLLHPVMNIISIFVNVKNTKQHV